MGFRYHDNSDYKSCHTCAAHPGDGNTSKYQIIPHNNPKKRAAQTSETSNNILVVLQGILGIELPCDDTCWAKEKKQQKNLKQGSDWAVYHSNKTLPVKRHRGLKSGAERRPTVSVNPQCQYRSTRHRTESFRVGGEIKGKKKKNSWQMMNYVSKDKGINKRLMCSVFGQENSGGAR